MRKACGLKALLQHLYVMSPLLMCNVDHGCHRYRVCEDVEPVYLETSLLTAINYSLNLQNSERGAGCCWVLSVASSDAKILHWRAIQGPGTRCAPPPSVLVRC